MTTLLLVLLLAILSSWYRLGLQPWVVFVLSQPDWIYNLLILLIVILRLSWGLYNLYQRVRPSLLRLFRALDRFGNGTSAPTAPVKGGNGKRSYSTSALSASGTNLKTKLLKTSGSHLRSDPRVREELTSPSVFRRFTIKDSFFATIAKRGTLVSLRVGKASNGYPQLSTLVRKIGFRIFGAVFPYKGKYLSRIRQLHAFAVHLANLTRHHGPAFTVKYLKASTLAIQKSIAGTPVSSLRELEPSLPLSRLSNGGLPKFIPLRDRRLILINSSSSVIRWWLTLFSIYRVIDIPGVVKWATITDPLTTTQEIVDQVASGIKLLIPTSSFDLDILCPKPRLAYGVDRTSISKIDLLETASSTMKISWFGLISDVMSLQKDGTFDTMIAYLTLTKQDYLRALLSELGRLVPLASSTFTTLGRVEELFGLAPTGRLALKKEAAGKVRVFAMVTIWDQAILKPLHSMMFSFLRALPNDGTFDQEHAVRRCLAKSKMVQGSFGYDLSAATDRLPASLQSQILDTLLPGLGPLWRSLLTSREFSRPDIKEKGKEPVPQTAIRYAVGQPMGALSSWAMLAVTHHMIAQYAANMARAQGATDPFNFWIKSWYTGYEVLGDDIVFFEQVVAHQYLLVMDQLGVPINLAKSVVAKNATFEFAKVTGHNGVHVAGLSWAMFMAQPTAMGRVGILYSLLRKGIVKTGIGSYINTLSRENARKLGNPNLFYLALGTMFAKAGKINYSELFYSILSVNNSRVGVSEHLEKPLTGLLKGIVEAVRSSDPVSLGVAASKALDLKVSDLALKRGLVKTIKVFVYGSPTDTDVRTNFLNPKADAEKMAKTVVMQFLAASPEGRDIVQARLESAGVFRLVPLRAQSAWSPAELLAHAVFCHLYAQYYESFLVKWERLVAVKPLQLKKLSLVDLMNLFDIIDRYCEETEILSRAEMKLAKEEIPLKNLVENPLDILKRVLKSESRIESMRRVVIDSGIEVITKIFARGETPVLSMEDVNEDNPGYRPPASPIPLHVMRSYIEEFGEEFILTHLPKWSKYGTLSFGTPGPEPEFTPFMPLQGQPEYLYAISRMDTVIHSLSNSETSCIYTTEERTS